MTTDSTKLKILEAARELFVANGFAGTSMGKIAKLAAVNHSLIYHHFVNKEGLWTAVKMSIVNRARSKGSILPSRSLPFAEFIAELLESSIQFYRANPDIAKLIHWQRVEADQGTQIGVTESEASLEWIEAFKQYRERGEIDKRHRPEFILTLVASIASSAALDPNVFIAKGEAEKDYINFSARVLAKGLAK